MLLKFKDFIKENHDTHVSGGKLESIPTHKIMTTEGPREWYHKNEDSQKRIQALKKHYDSGGKTSPIAVKKIPAKDQKSGTYLGLKTNGATHAVLDGHHRLLGHEASGKSHIDAIVNPKKME